MEGLYMRLNQRISGSSLKKGDILKVTAIMASPQSSVFQAEGTGTMFFPEKWFDPLFLKVGSTVFYNDKDLVLSGVRISKGMTFQVIELEYDPDSLNLKIKIQIPDAESFWFPIQNFRIILF